jgi:hypothetical protein
MICEGIYVTLATPIEAYDCDANLAVYVGTSNPWKHRTGRSGTDRLQKNATGSFGHGKAPVLGVK